MSPSRVLLALTLTALLGARPASVQASLDLSVLNSSAPIGGVGSFDVVLSDSGGTYAVSGFSFELRVATNSGVLFTSVGVNTAPANPYIFGTLQTPPFSYSTFPTTDFIASDSDNLSPYTVTLTQGSIFGLGHVNYSVSPNAMIGSVTVSIVGLTGINPTTEVNDINGKPFPITATNGSIQISAAVPEPSSVLLVGVGLTSLFALVRRRPTRDLGVARSPRQIRE